MKKILSNTFLDFTEEELKWLEENNLYVGDIHNHCGISYGYGSLSKAIEFAKQQLDFFSVTGHFAWPDIAKYEEMEIPEDVIAYHKAGFEKLRKGWAAYMKEMNEVENENIVPFYSFEYHSFDNGDYTVLAKDLNTKLPEDPKDGEVDERLNDLIKNNNPSSSHLLAFPHHIGYKTGFRGINWNTYNEKTSPLIEILSMHGSAESYEAALKYLHTMGPRVGHNNMRGGLDRGYHFGVCANTDHHNASPGSYGFGRTGVFAKEKTRDAIWNSLNTKKTCAFSGDPIELALFANDKPIGSTVKKDETPIHYDMFISGYDHLESVDLIENGKIVATYKAHQEELNEEVDGYIPIAIGWGKKNNPCTWKVDVEIFDAEVIDYTPRLRGKDMVDPLDVQTENGELPAQFKVEGNKCYLQGTTDGNKTATTNSCQGFTLHTKGHGSVKIVVNAIWMGKEINRIYTYDIASLYNNAESEYLEGFVSPSILIGPFVPIKETESQLEYESEIEEGYAYLRCQQTNGDIAITSPIFIEK